MKFVIGLGNPGLRYRLTKHSVGFNIVKKIAKENKIDITRKAYSSFLGEGKISGEDVTLVLPQTYMNLSGKAVEELFRTEIKRTEDFLIICDDINLKLGRVRLKKGGSAGGHKGLESIINALGKSDFARLRVGIATDVHKGDITNYVLSPFRKRESKNAAHAIALASEATLSWVKDGIDMAMSRFNKRSSSAS